MFDAVTGQTHQLSPLAAATMAWLEEQPTTSRQLVEAIAADLGVTVDDDLERAVDAVIEQFCELDWIEPFSAP